MISKKIIEKNIRRKLDDNEWKRLSNAEYSDVFNWMIYYSERAS